MSEKDAWIRRITSKLGNASVRSLQLIYYFIVGLEQREARLKK